MVDTFDMDMVVGTYHIPKTLRNTEGMDELSKNNTDLIFLMNHQFFDSYNNYAGSVRQRYGKYIDISDIVRLFGFLFTHPLINSPKDLLCKTFNLENFTHEDVSTLRNMNTAEEGYQLVAKAVDAKYKDVKTFYEKGKMANFLDLVHVLYSDTKKITEDSLFMKWRIYEFKDSKIFQNRYNDMDQFVHRFFVRAAQNPNASFVLPLMVAYIRWKNGLKGFDDILLKDARNLYMSRENFVKEFVKFSHRRKNMPYPRLGDVDSSNDVFGIFEADVFFNFKEQDFMENVGDIRVSDLDDLYVVLKDNGFIASYRARNYILNNFVDLKNNGFALLGKQKNTYAKKKRTLDSIQNLLIEKQRVSNATRNLVERTSMDLDRLSDFIELIPAGTMKAGQIYRMVNGIIGHSAKKWIVQQDCAEIVLFELRKFFSNEEIFSIINQVVDLDRSFTFDQWLDLIPYIVDSPKTPIVWYSQILFK